VVPVNRWTTSYRPRVAAALAACCALAATEAGARAAAPTLVSLEYEIAPGIEGCPDGEQFRASVGRQLGYDPFRATAEKRVAVQIARKEIGFDGRIRWSDAGGHWVGDRRLSSRRGECAEIAASLAFSVAVQIQLLAALAPATTADPNAAPAEPARENASPPAAAASPETSARPREEQPNEAPVEVAAPAPPTAPTPASGPQLSIGAGPALAISVAPHAVGLGRLFASGRVGHFSLEIAGDAALPVNQYDSGGRGFTLDRFAAEAAACGHIAALAACVTGTAGRMQAHGFGVDREQTPNAWFSQVGARLAAAYDFSDHYFAAVRADGLVMTAPVKVILNQTLVWTTPRVGAVLGLDFGARFF
jgi:hypothetical protein